jgi:hypothetical protein
MTTLWKTRRARIACGLGSVLAALVALACLWGFSPSVTAGDKPEKKGNKPACAVPPVPAETGEVKKSSDVVPPLPTLEKAPKPPASADLPPTAGIPGISRAATGDPLPPPTPTPPPPADTSPPPLATGSVAPPPVTYPATPPPPPEPQDIKALVVQLTAIRGERAKLDEREKTTIQAIRQKYQEQKKALAQLEKDLRQLGVAVEEAAAENKVPGVIDSGIKPADGLPALEKDVPPPPDREGPVPLPDKPLPK